MRAKKIEPISGLGKNQPTRGDEPDELQQAYGNYRQAHPIANTRQAYDRHTGRPVARTQKAAPQKPVYVKGNKRIK